MICAPSLDVEIADRNRDGLPSDDAGPLMAENVDLRGEIARLRACVEDAWKELAPQAAEREGKYETLLEEKTEAIRQLYARLRELQRVVAARWEEAPPCPPGEDADASEWRWELERLRADLGRERQRLRQQRCRLREEEEGLRRRMRAMELQMAQCWADLARQREELKTMYGTVQADLEKVKEVRGQALSSTWVRKEATLRSGRAALSGVLVARKKFAV